MVLKNISPGCGLRASPMLFCCVSISFKLETVLPYSLDIDLEVTVIYILAK